jgi:NMD protein affecting ribosome stability and mRNA decay
MTENHQGIAVCRNCGNHTFTIRLFGDRTHHAVCNACFAQWQAPDWCLEQYFRALFPAAALDSVNIADLKPSPTPGIP